MKTGPLSLRLVDRSAVLCAAWQEAFEGYASVEIVQGDFFAAPADAMVVPANSFGSMGGGLAKAITTKLGSSIQKRILAEIRRSHQGTLPVGQAMVIATRHKSWPWLLYAPTMAVPQNIASTQNAYLALLAALRAAQIFDGANLPSRLLPPLPIRTILCPGLGTGTGGLDEEECAAQMRKAWDETQ